MSNLQMVGAGIGSWLGLLSIILLSLCFYFVLSFFQYLKKNDERLVKQSKFAAVFCFAIALIVPAVYQLYILLTMMQ